jgi:DNA-binding NtrC family response regulator
VIQISLPPLRERREDILPLTAHFIRKYATENSREVSDQVSQEVLSVLEAYNWPGNVRELENVIERAVIVSRSSSLQKSDLREEILNPRQAQQIGGQRVATLIDISEGISFYDEVNRFQIELIKRALEITGGHQSRAAKLLGMNTTTLNSKIRKSDITTFDCDSRPLGRAFAIVPFTSAAQRVRTANRSQ